MKKALSIFSILCCFTLTSCASKQRAASLESTVNSYARALREADGSLLLGFVSPEKQQVFASNSATLGSFKFSNVEVRKIFPDSQLDTALVSLSLEFFDQAGSELIETTRQYAWAFDPTKKAWFLKEATPFGSR